MYIVHARDVGSISNNVRLIGVDAVHLGIRGNQNPQSFAHTATHIHKCLDVFEPFVFVQTT